MSRPARRRAAVLAASAALSLALGACSPESAAPATPLASGEPITVAHGDRGLEAAVAAVVARHLRLHGHAVTKEAGVPVDPPAWAAAGGDTIAVVDTLALAAEAEPAAALPAPPTPTATRTPGGSAPGAAPGGTPAASASATATPSPTELPDGEPAADADGSGRILEELLAAETAESAEGAPATTSEGAEGDEAVRVLGSSAGVQRLTAVVTQTTAARLGLGAIDDLNGRCELLTAAAPAAFTSAAAPHAAAALRSRLDRLAGCRPEAWLDGTTPPTAAVVADEAQVALLRDTDPEIETSMLVPLEDGDRVLPEGRLAVVGSAAVLDDDAERRIGEVLSALDAGGLRELERLTTGDDALPPAAAAQYWLVDRGLEDAPRDWVLPRGSWF